jgi:hypothetical protein
MQRAEMLEYLSSFYKIQNELEDFLKKTMIHKRVGRGAIFHKEGSAAQIWFIQEGLAKGFYYDQDGREHITRFWSENQMILLTSPSERFHMGTADHVQLLENASLTTLSHASIAYMHQSYAQTARFTSKILLADRNMAELKSYLCALPARQAYQQFKRYFPYRRLPLKDIAGFLEITPGTLSEVRRENK